MAIYRHTAGTVAAIGSLRFQNDVLEGLRADPKYLPPKYFYDAAGDALFQQIMTLPEYYLTRCEQEIFTEQTAELADCILALHTHFDIIELGPGDASKSALLLQYLIKQAGPFTYYPVDISGDVIEQLQRRLPLQLPGLRVQAFQGTYQEMVEAAVRLSDKPKLVLFLGANIGNMEPEDALTFLKQLQQSLSRGDLLLLGIDLKKDPSQILAAYNDGAGITSQFNLNLLTRMNNELQADFNIDAFVHYPTYDPVTGACKSYLISRKNQIVHLGEQEINFYEHEPIYMELSQKYSVAETDLLARQSGFKPIGQFFDKRGWFLNTVWLRQA